MLSAEVRGVWGRIGALAQRRLVREGLWIVSGRAVTAIAGLVSLRLFTELAPPSVFGAANLLLGMLALGMNALVAPITQTQLRYHTAHQDAGDGDHYTYVIARFVIIGALVLTFLVGIALLMFPALRAGSGWSVGIWLALWIAVSAARGVLINRLQAERQQQRYAVWLGAEAMFVMVATAAILVIFPTVEGLIAGQVCGNALATVVLGGPALLATIRSSCKISRKDAADFSGVAWRQVVRYGLPFLPFALLGWFSSLADRYVLAAFLDVAAVGTYIAAFGIASRLPPLVAGAFNDLFRPALFEAESRGETAHARRLFAGWLLLVSLIAASLIIAIALLGDWLAEVMLAPTYRAGAKEIMLWVATGYCCTIVAQVIEIRILSFGASRPLLLTKLFGAITNVTFALLLIPSAGALGAAYANAAGQASLLIATAIVAVLEGRRRAGARTLAVPEST